MGEITNSPTQRAVAKREAMEDLYLYARLRRSPNHVGGALRLGEIVMERDDQVRLAFD
jgi:hypothetical protein